MKPHLQIPNEQRNSSIEAYKVALRDLENGIASQYAEAHADSPAGGLNPLCGYCAAVGERLHDIFRDPDVEGAELNLGGARDAAGNLYLGTLGEVFARDNCALCGLIQRQFLRANRRRIYGNAGLKKRGLDGLALVDLLNLAYGNGDGDGVEEEDEEEEEGGGWIAEVHSRNLQVSLNTVISDGVLSLWWPESTVDEVNDEPAQIPMMAADHEGVFSRGETLDTIASRGMR
ncbi:hypothetical protein EYC84_000704 [Monilinia fructicola]|uniref:Uncharacterized protein n=1 Tax=Monilinia fructicola TaxID=38448 RepID=A0A5M9JIB0_MONFR|nr:hypothetical protein EYC84_000704 [Monilinia fructicola]